MLNKLILSVVLLSAFSLSAQRDLTPGKRRGDVLVNPIIKITGFLACK